MAGAAKTPTVSLIQQDKTLECQIDRMSVANELFITQTHILNALKAHGFNTELVASCQGNGVDSYKVSFKEEGQMLKRRLTDCTIPVGTIFKLHFRKLGGEVDKLTVYNVPYEVSDGLFKKAFTNFGNIKWHFRPKMKEYKWVETGIRFAKLAANPMTRPPDFILFEDEVHGIVKCPVRRKGVKLTVMPMGSDQIF